MLHLFVTLLFSFFLQNVCAVKLVPINNPADLISADAITKRNGESCKEDLDLQNVETFFWGAPAGKNLIYANLTVYFPEQYEHVVAMERFAGQLKSVQCTENMVLEFINDEAFEYAKSVWSWVHQGVNNTFVMVTNYEGCADDMERLPFVVSEITYDEENNKAYLNAELKEWQEVAHSYTLHLGHMPLTPVHRMLMKKGVMPRAVDFTMSLESSFDQNLFSGTFGGWTTSIDATVSTTGTLNVEFDLDIDWFNIQSASFTVNPDDVSASLELALTEKGTLLEAYGWQETIVSIPIQGIEIAKIVKIGAFLNVDVGFTMEEWTGEAFLSVGAKMAISNDAIVVLDLANSKNNQFSGWAPTLTPIPPTLSAKVEGSAKAFLEPNVKIEASALGLGWNVGLGLQMPYISADFAAMFSTEGVCQTDKTLGVDIDTKIGIELSAQAASKGNEANPFWKQTIFSHEWDLFSTCLAFDLGNFGSGDALIPNLDVPSLTEIDSGIQLEPTIVPTVSASSIATITVSIDATDSKEPIKPTPTMIASNTVSSHATATTETSESVPLETEPTTLSAVIFTSDSAVETGSYDSIPYGALPSTVQSLPTTLSISRVSISSVTNVPYLTGTPVYAEESILPTTSCTSSSYS
ncbi:hypothetical protein BS50DRAFT_629859 [Corynespora cassiicola Philippines]|uniref:Uncharacterized protein n=1 Tax=Corynespora cassiicola Philippines TaxID=1448308 RepID=A0A2T2P224_CORCC|nr:hypothetical protein BS50DRAFT_629859 [Corynespora cassiicola Philippines]